MKFSKLFFVSMAVLLSGACSSDDDKAGDPRGNRFNLSSSILPVTRSPQLDEDGMGLFQEGDRNTLFFSTTQNEKLGTLVYTYGTAYYWSDLQFLDGMENCSISGCYPTVEAADREHFEWNVTGQQDWKDFLLAAPVQVDTRTSQTVELGFSHALHKLKVELRPEGDGVDAGMLSKAEITCRNFLPVAEMDLSQGKVLGAKGALAGMKAVGSKTAFLVPAQEVGSMEVFIKLGDREFVYTLSSCRLNGESLKKLESGKSFTLVINVSKNSFTVGGQGIGGWGNQGEYEDSIII